MARITAKGDNQEAGGQRGDCAFFSFEFHEKPQTNLHSKSIWNLDSSSMT